MEALEILIAKAAAANASTTVRNEAFGQIVRYFQDMVYGFAYALLSDAQLAEDAAQEAFITAYRNLDQLREVKAFSGWLRRIVLTECNRITRKRIPTIEPIESATEIPADGNNPAEIVVNREMKAHVHTAIRSLPENERMVVTLFYIDQVSQRKIANFLDVPVMTVKNRLRSARNRLRGRMIEMVQEHLHERRPSKDEQFANKVRLFVAIRAGDLARAKEILKIAPELASVKEDRSETLLHQVCVDPNSPTAKRIVRSAKKGDEGWTPLHWAAWTGQVEMADLLLLNGADVNAKPAGEIKESGVTPLHWAARNGYSTLVERLLVGGADVNATDNDGQTPLHLAAVTNQKDAVKRLLGYGADVNVATHTGATPLHWSAINGYFEIVDLLLDNGAEVNAKDNRGRTPMYWAEKNGRIQVKQRLRQYGRKDKELAKNLQSSDRETPITVPVGEKVLGRLLNATGTPIDNLGSITDAPQRSIHRATLTSVNRVATDQILETGIKIIDLMAPIVHGGKIVLSGEFGAGKLVVAGELMHHVAFRLGGCPVFVNTEEKYCNAYDDMLEFKEAGIADKMAVVFGQLGEPPKTRKKSVETGLTIAEHFRDQSGKDVLFCVNNRTLLVPEIRKLQSRIGKNKTGAITGILLTDDSTPEAEIGFSRTDGKIALSSNLAKQLIYPAINPLTSQSRLLDEQIVGSEHYQVAYQVKEILQHYRTLDEIVENRGVDALKPEEHQVVVRARRIQRFLTQPFFVAQVFSNLPGEYVPLSETIRGVREILEGKHDGLPEDAFCFIGNIDQAIEKAKTLST